MAGVLVSESKRMEIHERMSRVGPVAGEAQNHSIDAAERPRSTIEAQFMMDLLGMGSRPTASSPGNQSAAGGWQHVHRSWTI